MIDDFEVEPDLLGNAIAEFRPVLRHPARLGRDQPGAGHAAAAHFFAAYFERRNGTHDRRLADATGDRHAFAQPDDARKRIDHAEGISARAGNEQPAIIGSEIEGGIGVADSARWPALAGQSFRQDGQPLLLQGRQFRSLRGHNVTGDLGLMVHGNYRPARPKPENTCGVNRNLALRRSNPKCNRAKSGRNKFRIFTKFDPTGIRDQVCRAPSSRGPSTSMTCQKSSTRSASPAFMPCWHWYRALVGTSLALR